MYRTKIRIGGMNQAIGARRLLSSAGLETRVIKLSNNKSFEGCAYGIEVLERDLFDIARILRMNGIAYQLDEGNQ